MKLPAQEITTCKVDDTKAGETIRVLRKKKKISLRLLAERMSISAPYLSDLERGRRNWNQERFDAAIKLIAK